MKSKKETPKQTSAPKQPQAADPDAVLKSMDDEAEAAETEMPEDALSDEDVGDVDAEAEAAQRSEDAERAAAWEDKYLRLYAEYENYRKRTAREKSALYDDSVADVVRSWLPVLDNLERAQKAIEQVNNAEVKTVAEGLGLIQEQANAVLAELGVEVIEALGQPFSPEIHEAVMHVEDESLGENEVAEVFQTGYRRGERVLRHSVVKVAN